MAAEPQAYDDSTDATALRVAERAEGQAVLLGRDFAAQMSLAAALGPQVCRVLAVTVDMSCNSLPK